VTARPLLLNLIFLTIIAFALIVKAGAVEPDEMLSDLNLEARARAISSGLRCLVCFNETIDESQAPLARDLRLLVRERLIMGATDQEIIDFITARYGDFILLRPRFNLKTAALWLSPLLILCVIFGTIFLNFKRRHS